MVCGGTLNGLSDDVRGVEGVQKLRKYRQTRARSFLLIKSSGSRHSNPSMNYNSWRGNDGITF